MLAQVPPLCMNVLCALICRGTHVLAEYDQSDGEEDLCELCRGILPELASVRESRQYVVRGYSINYVTSGTGWVYRLVYGYPLSPSPFPSPPPSPSGTGRVYRKCVLPFEYILP